MDWQIVGNASLAATSGALRGVGNRVHFQLIDIEALRSQTNMTAQDIVKTWSGGEIERYNERKG